MSADELFVELITIGLDGHKYILSYTSRDRPAALRAVASWEANDELNFNSDTGNICRQIIMGGIVGS